MSRDQGFRTADIDVGLLADPKVRRLARRLKDPAAMNAAVVTYLSVLLASWDDGERICAEDVAPGWMDELDTSDLEAEGLLDAEGRIPERAWANWYGPAIERRLIGQRGAIFGGLRRQGLSVEEANKEADRRIHPFSLKAQPTNLSLQAQPPTTRPTVRPSPRPRTDEDEGSSGEAAPLDGAPRSPEEETEAKSLYLASLPERDARRRPLGLAR